MVGLGGHRGRMDTEQGGRQGAGLGALSEAGVGRWEGAPGVAGWKGLDWSGEQGGSLQDAVPWRVPSPGLCCHS